MALMDKRVKLDELELLAAKGIQVTVDQTATLEKWVKLENQVTEEKRVTQAVRGSRGPSALQETKGQRARVGILAIPAHREKTGDRGQMDHLDLKENWEGEGMLGQRGHQELLGRKEQRENEGCRVVEDGLEKMD